METLQIQPVEKGTEKFLGKGLYLCCFFKGDSSLVPEIGMDGVTRTFTIRHLDMGALVSPVPMTEFGEESINRLVNDLMWLSPKVKRHEELVHRVMDRFPVLPVKFGTIYTDEEKILRIMKCKYEDFSSFFELVRGREEWGFKVFMNKKKYLKTAQNNPDLEKEIPNQINLISPGKSYFLRKKGEMTLQREISSLSEKLALSFFQRIGPMAVQGKRTRVLSKEATGISEEMILNSAFLVEKAGVPSFKKAVQDLAGEYEPEIVTFKTSGPWPPYHFCPENTV